MTSRGRRAASATAAGLLATALLAGCGGDETVVQEAEEEGPVATAVILGETVTIQSEVEEVLGPLAFTVGEDETLVMTATESDVEEGDEVVARGTVRQMALADFDRDYDWFDGDAEWVVDYDRDLVLVADAVEVVDE